jgi:hypothetical protein
MISRHSLGVYQHQQLNSQIVTSRGRNALFSASERLRRSPREKPSTPYRSGLRALTDER